MTDTEVLVLLVLPAEASASAAAAAAPAPAPLSGSANPVVHRLRIIRLIRISVNAFLFMVRSLPVFSVTERPGTEPYRDSTTV